MGGIGFVGGGLKKIVGLGGGGPEAPGGLRVKLVQMQ